jgi:hypothetical protein
MIRKTFRSAAPTDPSSPPGWWRLVATREGGGDVIPEIRSTRGAPRAVRFRIPAAIAVALTRGGLLFGPFVSRRICL